MEKIKPGKYVELGYDLYEVQPDGSQTLVHQTDIKDPEKIVYGVTPGVIRPLEAAIEGLEAGGEFDLVVKSDEAFGPRDPEQIVPLEKEIFMVDGKFDSEAISKGAYVPMMTGDGFRITGKVIDVTDSHVKMDFNHPLVGKDLRFKGSVVTVRDATPEELHPTCGGGCGGCGGGSCSDGDGCDCSDGGCCSK